MRTLIHMHGLINQSKMSSSKKLTYTGTLQQVFIRVYIHTEIQSVMLVFSTQLCELLPL